jgi:hypothetical protein
VKGKEKEVDENLDEDRAVRLRRLVEEGRLEELKTEVFGKGVLDMLKNGNTSSDST